MLLLPNSAPKKFVALCFVSTGPKSPSVMFSVSVSYIAIPHPAGQFSSFTLLFVGHDPSVYILVSSCLCLGVWGCVSSSFLSFFQLGSVFSI